MDRSLWWRRRTEASQFSRGRPARNWSMLIAWRRYCCDALFFDTLQQTRSVIARDQRQVLVSGDIAQQRHELVRVGKTAAGEQDFKVVQKLWCIQRLILARHGDFKNKHSLIGNSPVFVNQSGRLLVIGPIEFGRA